MVLVSLCILFSFFLVVFLKVVSFLISESVFLNREELSPYECGFEHHNVSRIPFSLRYFFLTLLFLLFDLEVILLLFVPYFLISVFPSLVLLSVLLFLLVLFLSLLYE
jgi:NADH-ubiquinone oxidoreductase chain 3